MLGSFGYSVISCCFKCHISKTNKLFWVLSLEVVLEVADVHQRRVRKFTNNCHTSFCVWLDRYIPVNIQFISDSCCPSGTFLWYLVHWLPHEQCGCGNRLFYKFSQAVLLDIVTMITITLYRVVVPCGLDCFTFNLYFICYKLLRHGLIQCSFKVFNNFVDGVLF